MTFDDLPLIRIEKEVMAEIGAWKNFDELESYLTLLELMELYDISNTRQSRMMKTIAAAMGADVSEDEEDDYEANKGTPKPTFTENGEYIPGAINSQQDAGIFNSFLGGSMLGYEVHN